MSSDKLLPITIGVIGGVLAGNALGRRHPDVCGAFGGYVGGISALVLHTAAVDNDLALVVMVFGPVAMQLLAASFKNL